MSIESLRHAVVGYEAESLVRRRGTARRSCRGSSAGAAAARSSSCPRRCSSSWPAAPSARRAARRPRPRRPSTCSCPTTAGSPRNREIEKDFVFDLLIEVRHLEVQAVGARRTRCRRRSLSLLSSVSASPAAGGNENGPLLYAISNKLGARKPVPMLVRYLIERSEPRSCT